MGELNFGEYKDLAHKGCTFALEYNGRKRTKSKPAANGLLTEALGLKRRRARHVPLNARAVLLKF